MHFFSNLSQPLIYFLAFAIIFAETGIATFFFLPGDTLLFSLGIFAKQNIISLPTIILILITSAILGNILGYYLGSIIREKRHSSKLLQKIPEKYIVRTESFYKKYGSYTVLLSRFVPIVRTIAPFLAGISKMVYKKYIIFSILGAMLWVSAVTLSGYIFGSYVSVKNASFLAGGLMIMASVITPILVFISKKYLKKS